MPAFVNEITEQPTDPIGGASGSKRKFNVQFLAKSGNSQFPFTVANEVVATIIGQAIGLNLPSILTYCIRDEPLVFIQMVDRDPDLANDPPSTRQALRTYVENHPDEVHGAIVFDLFIVNNDRAFGPERRNVLLDATKQLLLYDHGNACFYRNRPERDIEAGMPRLKSVEADISALFDMAHKGNHYFELLSDWSLVEKWCARIREIPDFLIESAIRRIPGYVSRPTPDERSCLIEFLMDRRRYLIDHIAGARGTWFPKLPKRGSHA